MASNVATRRGADGALFTSSKCPPGPGLESSCELPFAFIWTPMSRNNNVALIECRGESLPPVLCLNCLAYLNMYADMDIGTGIWQCPFCGHSNVTSKEEFAGGGKLSSVLAAPVVEFHQRLGPKDFDVDPVDPCTYVLVVDGNLAGEEAKAITSAMQSFFDDYFASNSQPASVQLGLIVFDKTISMYHLGNQGMASADIFTPEEANDEEALVSKKNSLRERPYLTQVEPGDDLSSLWRCLSAVFGVSVETRQDAKTQNETETGSNSQSSRAEMLRRRKDARKRKQILEREGKPNNTQVAVSSPWVTNKTKSAALPSRCTGEAIQCAIDMTSLDDLSRTSRILLFTNGCPNIGDASVVVGDETVRMDSPSYRQIKHAPDVVDPGMLVKAVKYFDLTANYALENGVIVDIFCTGANELGLPAYQALAEPSGGYVLPHTSFTSPHMKHNLKFILEETFASRSGNMENGDGRVPAECFVDLRADSFVTPTYFVGPGEILPLEGNGIVDNERAAFAVGASLAANHHFRTNNLPSKDVVESSLTRIRLGRVDPLTTLSVMLLVNESYHPDDNYACFQFTCRHVSRDGKTLVTRVSTHRLPIAKSVADFVEEVDDEVVPVVLAKGAVYRALHGREETDDSRVLPTAGDNDLIEKLAYEAQLDLDATIQRISSRFRLLGLEKRTRSDDLAEEGGVMASHSSLDFAFPPELADALHALYHLRRGSLLSPGPMRSMDDRASARELFLRFPLEHCLNIMAPRLWSPGENVNHFTMDSIPAETLALWDNRIIAVDHHDSLFLWSGRKCKGPEFDDIRQRAKRFLVERSQERFPMAEFHRLSEGDSMSRRLVARLAPSHADPPDHQIAHFPALASLSPKELEALRSKFRFYDASADASFRTWFWNVSSATHASRKAGLSLCE